MVQNLRPVLNSKVLLEIPDKSFHFLNGINAKVVVNTCWTSFVSDFPHVQRKKQKNVTKDSVYMQGLAREKVFR